MKNDAGYHLLFSHPEMVEDLLRHFVQEKWVHNLDFKTLKRVNAKLQADNLKRREGDVIYSVQTFSGHPVYLYIMLEFQSQSDRWMALRFNTYASLLWQHLVKEKQLTVKGFLPPIMGLVLYNGDARWTAPRQLSELIDLASDSYLQAFQPQMRYYLIEENQYPHGKLGSLSGILFKLENCKFQHQLPGLVAELIDLLTQPEWRKIKRDFSIWLQQVCLPAKGLEIESDQIENLSEVNNMLQARMIQWEKELLAKGLEKGLAKGLEKGREEGIEKGIDRGKMNLLDQILTRKFGALPDWAQNKLQMASSTELERWALKIFDAASLEELFK